MCNLKTKMSGENLTDLFNNEKFADVQFLVNGDRKIYGHSLVLSLASPVFAAQFDQTLNERKLIPLLNEEYDTVHSFIKYLYTYDLSLICYENCFDLLKLALKYETLDLEQNVLACICRNTTVRNTLRHFEFFVNLNYRFMSEHYKCDIAELLKFHLDLDEFLRLSLKSVNELLDINVLYHDATVYPIIHSIMKWGENKCAEYQLDNCHIRHFFGEAVKKIKFTSMTVAELTSFTNLYPFFFEDSEVGALFNIINRPFANDMCNYGFTMERFTKKVLHVAEYNFLQGGQLFNVIFNTKEPIEILGFWIGATRMKRKCQVRLSDENGDLMNDSRMTVNVFMINQFAFPIKFRRRLILEPNKQYRIQLNYEETNCDMAKWSGLESIDIIGTANVELLETCQFIRKIHFERLI